MALTSIIAPRCFAFVKESNQIEGITRNPTKEELEATEGFLKISKLYISDLEWLQSIYAPGFPLRNKQGMDVRVGNYEPPAGGMEIEEDLMAILNFANSPMADGSVDGLAYKVHMLFELLHPFQDGNGRTGRALWAWVLEDRGLDPFSMPFLQRFYYQTLSYNSGNENEFLGKDFKSWKNSTY